MGNNGFTGMVLLTPMMLLLFTNQKQCNRVFKKGYQEKEGQQMNAVVGCDASDFIPVE